MQGVRQALKLFEEEIHVKYFETLYEDDAPFVTDSRELHDVLEETIQKVHNAATTFHSAATTFERAVTHTRSSTMQSELSPHAEESPSSSVETGRPSSSSTRTVFAWHPLDAICTNEGCNRERQYPAGCDWPCCCKRGYITGCVEHEDWCDRDWKQLQLRREQLVEKEKEVILKTPGDLPDLTK